MRKAVLGCLAFAGVRPARCLLACLRAYNMYTPKYTITTEILKNIGWVEAAREVIDNAPLVPAWEAKFRDEARLKAAHYGTVLEGNDLTLGEAKLILDKGMETPSEAAEAGGGGCRWYSRTR